MAAQSGPFIIVNTPWSNTCKSDSVPVQVEVQDLSNNWWRATFRTSTRRRRYNTPSTLCSLHRRVRKRRRHIQPSQLTELSAQLDENGLIRLEGRLMFAEYVPYMTWSSQLFFQGVIPWQSWSWSTIMRWPIMQQVTFSKVLLPVKKSEAGRISAANAGKWKRSLQATQVMAPLPAIRLRFTFRPFDQCAVDYAEPFETIQGRAIKRQKRYLCLFTCLQNKSHSSWDGLGCGHR